MAASEIAGETRAMDKLTVVDFRATESMVRARAASLDLVEHAEFLALVDDARDAPDRVSRGTDGTAQACARQTGSDRDMLTLDSTSRLRGLAGDEWTRETQGAAVRGRGIRRHRGRTADPPALPLARR
jgi:hypothetical protein